MTSCPQGDKHLPGLLAVTSGLPHGASFSVRHRRLTVCLHQGLASYLQAERRLSHPPRDPPRPSTLPGT